MSEHNLSLPENIYNSLLDESQALGISPTDWIASQLSLEKDKRCELSPAEKAAAFREWADNHQCGVPLLSNEAISRENLYSNEQL
ncbi:MAG: hypothetical protein AAGK10_17985 [Cyanobacteria bacterium J06555_3]